MELNGNDPDAGKDRGQEEKGVIEDKIVVDGITDSMDTSQCSTQASLYITNSQSLFKLKSIKSGMPLNHLILWVPYSSCLQSLPGSLPMNRFFASGGRSIRVSASESVLPMNIQDWFPLGWTGWISLQSKGLSRGFSNTTDQKHQVFGAQLSL